jgi:nucleoid DNA-binding protein
MSRCIIHVGMHKTGTSSIQQSLNGFDDANFTYYRNPSGGANHAGAIFKILGSMGADRPRRHEKGKVPTFRSNRAEIENLTRSLRSLGTRSLIISAEGLRFLSREELGRLKSLLERHVDRLEIVAYIRPPAAYMSSFVQQLIRGRSTTLDPERGYCHYRSFVSKFDDVFGAENVRLWKFDPRSFPGGCVVRDLCSRLGVELPAERIRRTNESLSRDALCLLYTYRRSGLAPRTRDLEGQQYRRLLEQMRSIGGKPFRLSPEAVRPILEKYRPDVAWMEARLGQSLGEELGDPQPEDIRHELDLLRPRPPAVRELVALLGDLAPGDINGDTPEQVGRLMNLLMEKQKADNDERPARTASALSDIEKEEMSMNVKELITEIRKTDPKLLEGIDESSAEEIIRLVFQQINRTLSSAGEGVVQYQGLGRFRVKKMKKEGKGGDRTRIVFRAMAAGGQQDDGDED